MYQRVLMVVSLLGLLAGAAPGAATAQHFGKNKVQYRSFDFQIIKTDHFDVYFYEDERQAALDAARMLERGYARFSRLLRHEFRERKPVILYASHTDFQQTNAARGFIREGTAAMVEQFKERMIIPFTGSYAYFERVLLHELAHQFQIDIMYRGGGGAGGLTNRSSPMALYWFREGMAEYLAQGRVDPWTQSWVRDAALAGYLPTLEEMFRRNGFLSYRFGQALWAYIGANWGDEMIGILLQKSLRIGIERAFESTLGISLEQLSREWMGSVRATYLPQVTRYQSPSNFAEPLLRHAELDDPGYLAPAISPDGNLMAYLSTEDALGGMNLFLADARTGEVIDKLIEGARDPDFESLRYMNSSAAFSADGAYLAFAAKVGGQDALYVYDIKERDVVDKLRFDQINGIRNPSWAPDNRHIVFAGMDGGLTDLFVTDLEGNLRRLTHDRYANLLPSWSPDGSAIAFTTDRGPGTDFSTLTMGNYRIGIYHLDQDKIELLPNQDVGNYFNPEWSPDGRSIIAVSDRTGIHDLYLFDLARDQLSRITHVLSGVIAITPLSPTLAWARDDGRLLFVYFEQGNYSIYGLDDPRSLMQVAVADLPEKPPSLFPDFAEPRAANALEVPKPDEVLDLGMAPDADKDGLTISSFYRTGKGFRPSADLSGAPAAGSPVSIMALLDSAAYALPDTTDFKIVDYSVKFTPDMIGRPTIGATAGGYYGNGIYGGSFIALSDMLGNHNILLAGNVNGSFSDAMFFAGYNFLRTRANYQIGIQQVPVYRYYGRQLLTTREGDQAIADVLARDVTRSARGVVSYPFSTFRRVELGATGVYVKRDYLFRGVNLSRGDLLDEDRRVGELSFFQPSAALVFDNALYGYTGPIAGRRYRLQVSQTFGDFSFIEGLVDFRNYFNFDQHAVFAARFLGLTRIGDGTSTFAQFWGGPYFLRGYDGDSFEQNSAECQYLRQQTQSFCPLAEQLIGSSFALMNLELRVPIITELHIGFLGTFPPIDAVAFFDGGLAWSDDYCLDQNRLGVFAACENEADVRLVWDRKPGENPLLVREPLFATGLGLRINVFYTILRLDYTWPLSRPDSGGVFSFSFGPSF